MAGEDIYTERALGFMPHKGKPSAAVKVLRSPGFTLVELLIVIGILAILGVVAVVILNPAEFLAESRDTTRVNDLKTIEKAISSAIATGGLTDNTQPNRVYVSLPDTNADTLCTEYTNLPALSGGWEYRCMASSANLQNVNGTGWIPLDLTSLTGMNTPLSNLPVDPENTEENYYAYSQGSIAGTYALAAPMESQKYEDVGEGDGGNGADLYETAPVAFLGGAPFNCGDVLTDPRDGKGYATVLIGSQCWMAQGLNIGTRINNSQEQNNDGEIEKYCYGDVESNCSSNNNPTYPDGGLYEWAEAMALPFSCGTADCSAQIQSPHQGICPSGWHVPTDTELKTLIEGQATVGCETGMGWQCSPAGTNLKPGGSSGFEGNLAGYRVVSGPFQNRTANAAFWSASQYSATDVWGRFLSLANATVSRSFYIKMNSFSVRCIKD